jgi:hypothetical protein
MGKRERILMVGGMTLLGVGFVLGWFGWQELGQTGHWVEESGKMDQSGEDKQSGGDTKDSAERGAEDDASGELPVATSSLPEVEKPQEETAVILDSLLPQDTPPKEKAPALAETEPVSGFSGLHKELVTFGFEAAKRKARDIDTLVLHSSFNNQGGDRYSVDKVLAIWKSYGVAPHFVIDRKGNVTELVEARDIAYHAGVSEMKDGRTNVNKFSLGVEILNAEDDSYTQAQYKAVNDLVAYLKKTYPLKYVVGHDTIAPGRKTDPWNFDWKKLEFK